MSIWRARTKSVVEPDYDYRATHAEPGYGEYYDRAYQAGYYAAVWDKIERPVIESLLQEFGGKRKSCLDFACGTGRVTNLDARFFGRVVGADVSESMLSSASVPPNVELRQIDITRIPLGEHFDVVTAFRFFLNAEDQLRHDALKAIHAHLKENGRLICNIHSNSTSINGLVCRLVNLIPDRKFRSHAGVADFTALLNSTGYTIERVVHYGFFPGPWGIPPSLAARLVWPVERLARWFRAPNFLATNFVVVCRKQSEQKS